jgi:hypothetical protein
MYYITGGPAPRDHPNQGARNERATSAISAQQERNKSAQIRPPRRGRVTDIADKRNQRNKPATSATSVQQGHQARN